MFRFQTGSIKSDNWIKAYAPHSKGFDSKLVRLKALQIFQTLHLNYRFRFQTGSIKSLKTILNHHGLGYGFDSKLVRLKVTISPRSAMRESRFDSKLVRLKEQPNES